MDSHQPATDARRSEAETAAAVLEFYFFLYAGCVTARADSRLLWFELLMWNPIFVVSNRFLCHVGIIKRVYRTSIIKTVYRTSFGGKALFRVESSKLASRVPRGFAAGIQRKISPAGCPPNWQWGGAPCPILPMARHSAVAINAQNMMSPSSRARCHAREDCFR